MLKNQNPVNSYNSINDISHTFMVKNCRNFKVMNYLRNNKLF